MTENLVQIENVSKIFEAGHPPALDHVTAFIPKGQKVGLAGPDGAGKTTLLRLIAGLYLPSTGKITVGGYDTKDQHEEVTNLISYMPQKFGLYEDLTVQQNLDLYFDLQGVVGPQRQETLKTLLDFTDLRPFTGRLAGALSGGMKQKLGLACALIRQPTLLLLDEPSVGVDPISRRELWELVDKLSTKGITVVWSTAYLDEAERCQSVLLLNEGKLLYSGSPSELTKRVKGRVFKITNIEGSQRAALVNVLNQKNVIDGVIQGKEIRIVTKEKEQVPIDTAALNAGNQVEVYPVKPRFEDAFLDILGGGPGGFSLLAQKTPRVMAKEKEIIDARGLKKMFGSFVAADDITFQVQQGEIFGLLGPNGAGKTTIFKMLCGLLVPTSGKAYVTGINLQTAPSEARSHIGYMAQKFSLYGDLTVHQNLNFFSGIYNLWGKQKRDAIAQMVEIFNFQSHLNEAAGLLPLGFKQRLALSCALMHHPEVLFLDEPTSGVDPITRREFWNHINGMVEKGVTVMVTTHFMDEAEYCDRIALVYRSKIITVGTPKALKDAARSDQNPDPTLEDAFVQLIEQYDRNQNVKP